MSVDLPNITELQRAADQCVKCAVCLPHCPTYALNREEAESPRGRITLLQGIVHGKLAPTDEVHSHLDSCLSCGRCEQVCPANVPYSKLIDGTRLHMNNPAQLQTIGQPSSEKVSTEQSPAKWSPETDADAFASTPSTGRRLMARSLETPAVLKTLHLVALSARALKLHSAFGDTRAGRLLRSLPVQESSAAKHGRVSSAKAVDANHVQPGNVAQQAVLFSGCLADSFEAETIAAVVELAHAYGIQLHPAPSGICCGALYQHQGNTRALQLARTALQSLTDTPASTRQTSPSPADAAAPSNLPIVALQSGCRRGLKDGLRLLSEPGAAATADRLVDLFELLERSTTPPSFVPPSGRVALYAPCSFDRNTAQCLKVIARDVVAIDQVARGLGCCGAAGDHMLTDPARADRLAQPIVEDILNRRYTHVLTPNAGCAWHLRDNLHKRGAEVVIEHPVVWMARQLAR